MRVEKRALNDALRVLGTVVCQTSPVELYRSVRFVGDENGIRYNVFFPFAFLCSKKIFSQCFTSVSRIRILNGISNTAVLKL